MCAQIIYVVPHVQLQMIVNMATHVTTVPKVNAEIASPHATHQLTVTLVAIVVLAKSISNVEARHVKMQAPMAAAIHVILMICIIVQICQEAVHSVMALQSVLPIHVELYAKCLKIVQEKVDVGIAY
jgi:hypothetical protein